MTIGPAARLSLLTWTRATWLGWLLGVPCVVALALLGEAFGIGGSQTLVGAGMGAGVGILQGRVLRRVGLVAGRWFGACVLGLALPFLAWDLASVSGFEWTYSLLACVTVGGFVAGILQAVLLRSRISPPGWVITSTLGWGLAGLLATSADTLLRQHSIRGLLGAGLYLALVSSGGLVLGAANGMVLARSQRTGPASVSPDDSPVISSPATGSAHPPPLQ